MGHKSILRQLEQKQQQVKLTFSTRDERLTGDAIVPENETVTESRNDLIKVEESAYSISPPKPECKWVNILYSEDLLKLYEEYYYSGAGVTEKAADDALSGFLQKNFNSGYMDKWLKSATPNVRRLVMLRVFIATFGGAIAGSKMDKLPRSHRDAAAKYVGLPSNSKITAVQDIFEKTQKSSSLEDMLLGRIGYLIIWYNMAPLAEISGKPGLDGKKVFYLSYKPD